MSDDEKVIIKISGFLFGWAFSIVQYLIIAGVMFLISYVVPSGINPWLVAVIVMLLWKNHTFIRLAIDVTIRERERES